MTERDSLVARLTADEIERIIIATEPSDGNERIWTRRMAVALEAALSGEPPQPVADAGDVAELRAALAQPGRFRLDDEKRLRKLLDALTRQSEQIASLTKERDEVIERSRERLVDNQRLRKVIASTHKNAVKHENCEKEYCPICEGGLFMCADCGAAEIEAEERICTAAESRLAQLEQEAVKVVSGALVVIDTVPRPEGMGEAVHKALDERRKAARAFLDKLQRPS